MWKKTDKDKEVSHWTISDVKRRMQQIADSENIDLCYYNADQGMGGYNYGASIEGCIMLSPFKKGVKGQIFGKYELEEDCDNPVECMFITFFHELAHCKLEHKIPNKVKGYSWKGTSRFQFEVWVTMLGIEYAFEKFGIKFSDQAVKWLLSINMSYIRNDFRDFGNGLTVKNPNSRSYTIVGINDEVFYR